MSRGRQGDDQRAEESTAEQGQALITAAVDKVWRETAEERHQ